MSLRDWVKAQWLIEQKHSRDEIANLIRSRSAIQASVIVVFRRSRAAIGRILTLPPQHRTSPRHRTASRPRHAARSTAQVALNLFTRAIAFGAAASRGRLAVRWQCQDAPAAIQGRSFPLRRV